MKSAYECVCELLDEKSRAALSGIPAELKEKLNALELRIGADEKLRANAIEFIAADIKSTPQRARQTIDRVCEFFMESQQGLSPDAILEKFKAKFTAKEDDGVEPEEKPASLDDKDGIQNPSFKENAKTINQQMLFRSFYAALDQKDRTLLADFIIKSKLCDAGLEPELRERVVDGRKAGKSEIDRLFDESRKGKLDDFAWLHPLLLTLFSGMVSSQNSLLELQRRFDAATSLKTAAPAEAPHAGRQVETSKDDATRKELEAKVAELQNDLKNKAENFAEKLDAEKRNSSTERQLFESESSKLKDDYSRRLKLHAHAFATFLDTLPQSHAAVGYGMLQSIINEWDGDLASIQERAKRFAVKPKQIEEPVRGQDSPKEQLSKAGSNWTLLACAALAGIGVVLIAAAIAISAWIFCRQTAPVSQQTPAIYSSNDISRLAGIRLDTQEDIAKAYDVLKPHATPDEISFLNARSQAIHNAKDGALPK